LRLPRAAPGRRLRGRAARPLERTRGGMSKAVAAAGNGYTMVENAPLQARNTFGVTARAAMLLDVHRTSALAELFDYAMLRTSPLLVLGAGSNVLFTRDWPGVVLSIFAHAIDVLDDDGAQAKVR